MIAPPRSRLYRLALCWLTLYRFAHFFRLAGEPHPFRMALKFTWLTL